MPPTGNVWQVPWFLCILNILIYWCRHIEYWFYFFFCCGILLSIATLAVAQNMRELYRLVLVDTPLAPYFSECITSEVNHLSRKHLFHFILFNFNQSVVLIVVEL
jgi:hypothetical protein